MRTGPFGSLPGLFLVVTASAGLLSGCKPPGDTHPVEADHEEEEKSAQLTVWGDTFEIFLEHRFIVAGVPTRFVTHVSYVASGEARKEGPATFVLRPASGAEVRHTEDAPARAGIYVPELTFPTSGEWEVTLLLPIDGREQEVKLPRFRVFATKEEVRNAPEPEAPEGISFLKEQQWKILLATRPAAKRRLVQRMRLAGTVEARPGALAEVTPPVAGRLLAPEDGKTVVPGDRVERGQVLARVQPQLAGADWLAVAGNRQQGLSLRQANEAMKFELDTLRVELTVKLAEVTAREIQSQAALQKAERTLARVRDLRAQEAKSEREVEEAEFALRAAQAEREANRTLEEAYRTAISRLPAPTPLPEDLAGAAVEGGLPAIEMRAPIAGVVTQSSAVIGQHVAQDRPVFTVLDAGIVFLRARVPEADTARLGATMDALFQPAGARDAFRKVTGEGGGRLVFLGLTVDPATRTVPLVYEATNPEGKLRIGMAGDLWVETALAEDALAVPQSALVEEDGRSVIFVMVSGETFEKRDVALGIRDGEWVQILSGLSAGEHLVVSGAYAVRLASVSTAIPAHGHAH